MVRQVVVEVVVHGHKRLVETVAQILEAVEAVDLTTIEQIKAVKVVLELLLWHIKDHNVLQVVPLTHLQDPDLLYINLHPLEIVHLPHTHQIVHQTCIIALLMETHFLQPLVVMVACLYWTVLEIILLILDLQDINKVPEQ
jgi:hypothetical protein